MTSHVYVPEHRRSYASTRGLSIFLPIAHPPRWLAYHHTKPMDTENVAPVGSSRGRATKRGLSGRNGNGVKQGKSGLSARERPAKLANPKAQSSAPQRRRALGDITNADSSRANVASVGGGKNAKAATVAGAGKAHGVKGPRGGKARSRGLLDMDRPVPLDENGNVADIEPIPAGAASYKTPPFEPDLVEELGLHDLGKSDPSAEQFLDEFPSSLPKEPMPFEAGAEDVWEGLEVMDNEEDGWRACDGDMGIFCIELPALTLNSDVDDSS